MLDRLLDDDQPVEVRKSITALTAARFATNTLYRLTPPFLAVIARGLGVSLDSMGVAISVGELAGLSGPFLGRRIDRTSRRSGMIVGLGMLSVAAAVAAASPHIAALAIALMILTLGKNTFDASMGAWIGDRVDYRRRGQVVAITETSWAAALLLGVPLLAIAVTLTSWRSAYALAGFLNVAMLVVLRRSLPPDRASATRPAMPIARVRWGDVLPAVGGFALLMMASQFVTVVFGAWLEDAFGFSTTEIGAIAFLLGAVELTASGGAIRLTDRLGKRFAVVLGAALIIPAALALGATRHAALAGVIVLMLFVVAFEFALVSGLPLVTELQPDRRALMFGLAAGAGTVGRGVAALLSTRLYTAHGMGGSAAASAVCAALVLVLFTRFVREPPMPPSSALS